MSSHLLHALPTHVFGLTAAAQDAMPRSTSLESEGLHTRPVAGHGEVAAVANDLCRQVSALLGNGLVHPLSQLRLHRQPLGPQTLGAGESEHQELALAGFPAAVHESKQVEGVWFALSPPASVAPGEAPELDQPCLLRVHLEPELAPSAFSHTLKALGVASGVSPPPLLYPQVERVVKVNVGRQRTEAAALHCTRLTLRHPALLQHACVQPFLDQPHNARLGHAVLDALAQGMDYAVPYPARTAPRSMLRLQPRACTRMTRGRRSCLSLQSMKLSFTTPCRL